MENEYDEALSTRRAIFKSYPQAIPGGYAITKRGTAPCKATCPAHVSIQGYIALTKEGKYREALELFKEAHPFPSVCGRVCHHPCEEACTRNDVEQPLAIQYLHRFLGDYDLSSESPYVPEIETEREERVAVIGSGPAGLSAAYFLTWRGYKVTVFEKLPVAGGMMAVGIPAYRLPRDVLADEIKIIEKMGVEIRTGVTFGEDVTLEGLKKDGFGAVFMATGLHLSRELGVEGEDLPEVLKGVDFLRQTALGESVSVGRKVIVIGGGNVAIDVALTSLRKGAEDVTLVCLEKREEMPAWEYEIEDALEEGVHIVNSLGPPSRPGLETRHNDVQRTAEDCDHETKRRDGHDHWRGRCRRDVLRQAGRRQRATVGKPRQARQAQRRPANRTPGDRLGDLADRDAAPLQPHLRQHLRRAVVVFGRFPLLSLPAAERAPLEPEQP